MRSFEIIITSKNIKSLKNFLMVYNLLFLKTNLLPELLNCSSKKYKKKIFSIIKSPHVYKTAQDQFLFKTYASHKKFNLEDDYIRLIFSLKKLKKNSFPDINLKFKYNKFLNKNIKSYLKINSDFIRSKTSLNVNYLRFLDFKGEEFFKKKSTSFE